MASFATIETPVRSGNAIGYSPFGSGGLAPAAMAGAINWRAAEVTLTDAQLRNLLSTPVLIVPAPGAGKIIMWHKAISACRTTSAFSVSQSASLRYVGGGGSVSLGTLFANSVNYWVSIATGVTFGGGGNDNLGLEVVGSSNPTGGATQGGAKIRVYYSIESIPV